MISHDAWFHELQVDPFFFPEEELPMSIAADDQAEHSTEAQAFLASYDAEEGRRQEILHLAWLAVRERLGYLKGQTYDSGQKKLFEFMKAWFATEASNQLTVGERPVRFPTSDLGKLAIIAYVSQQLFGATVADARARLGNVGKSRS